MERKRGKLEQFNRFVLGEETSGFSVSEGNMDALRGIRFVVTADADTTLPPGSVSRLVGTLAHPLNSACANVGFRGTAEVSRSPGNHNSKPRRKRATLLP